MKGYELIKAITENKIKDNTKIKVVNSLTEDILTQIEYRKGMLKWKTEEFDTSFLCNIDIEFEVIEENKEIEELKTLSPQSETYKSVVDNREKINELVRAVNKINKQLEEQETEDIDTIERELNKMF